MFIQKNKGLKSFRGHFFKNQGIEKFQYHFFTQHATEKMHVCLFGGTFIKFLGNKTKE